MPGSRETAESKFHAQNILHQSSSNNSKLPLWLATVSLKLSNFFPSNGYCM